jgi:tetratricopeptide (TPR) repeat protein
MKKYIFYILAVIVLFLCNIATAQTTYDYNKSGNAKYQNGDYEGAIQDYNKAIELAISDTLKLSDTIVVELLKKIDLKIGLSESYSFRGNSKSVLKDYRGAIQDYNKAIELHSVEDFDHTLYNRGIAKGSLQDYKGAIDDLNKAIIITPKFPDAWYGRATIKYYLKDKEGACLDWSKAGELGYSKAYDAIKEYCN